MSLTRDEQDVLGHVAAGRSPWHGWEDGYPARTGEGREAYEARARTITRLRNQGFIDPMGLLTPQGRSAAKALVEASAGAAAITMTGGGRP